MTGSTLMTVIALLGLLVGFLLILAGAGIRRRRGLGAGKTVSLDRVTLTSRRLGLTGRPDRLVKAGGTVIPEEWKSARTVRPWHRVQMGVYFLLIEQELGIRPPHGFLVLGDGKRQQIDNSGELRALVLDLAEQIRAAQQSVNQPILVNPAPGQCRPCGQRGNCGQAKI